MVRHGARGFLPEGYACTHGTATGECLRATALAFVRVYIVSPAQDSYEVSVLVLTEGAELTQIVGDAIGASVFGREPVSAWKDAVTRWREAGGDNVAEELAKEYAAAE